MAKKNQSLPPQKGTGGVDLHEIERLLEFMERHGLEEFEYAHDSFRVRLKKPSLVAPGLSRALAPQEALPVAASPSAHSPSAASPAAAREGVVEAPGAADVHVVKSPIVGTFYSAPTPGAAPFVTVGSQVEAGQVLCIIEAMKLMNEIEADVAGELVRVFVENGQPVEYGEPLFGINSHRKK
jgi:acetyl-CoA carboxylase biotin carboxyl carrier protein